jgi:hypothetical protein
MGPQTGTAPTYGLRGEAMDWYALRDRVVDRLRSRGRVGSVALYRTQESAVAQIIDLLTPDFRMWPHTGQGATELLCPVGAPRGGHGPGSQRGPSCGCTVRLPGRLIPPPHRSTCPCTTS